MALAIADITAGRLTEALDAVDGDAADALVQFRHQYVFPGDKSRRRGSETRQTPVHRDQRRHLPARAQPPARCRWCRREVDASRPRFIVERSVLP